MKIAFISYDFGEYSMRIANGLRAHGEVRLFLADSQVEGRRHLLDPQIKLHAFRKPRLRQPLPQIRTALEIVREVKRFNPDVIHFQHGHLWFNFALITLLRQYPLVVTIHDPQHHVGDTGGQNTPQRVMRLTYRAADRLIIHGRRLIDLAVSAHGLLRERIHFVPHVAIGDLATGAEGDFPTGAPNVLCFGRIWPYKGIDYLIQAEPKLSAAVPGATITIAGTGEDFARYRAMMRNPDRFIVHNDYIPDAQRDALFRAASAVVLPYIEASQSGVVPVAYSFARPVVLTTVGGLPDAVDDGKTGMLIPPRDSDALADALIKLLKDPAQTRRMGVAGRHKLMTEWSPEAVGAQTAEVYRLAMQSRARSPKSATVPAQGAR
jgi:glycosyltransferase involved in cell wall biosynthesis